MSITIEPDDIQPDTKWSIERGDDMLGVIWDEGTGMKRGRYAAWSTKAERRDGVVGFFRTRQEAVDAIAALWPAPAKDARQNEPENLATHTGLVHAPGRYFKQIRSNAPKCCASASAVMRMHYLIPTNQPVTCKRCLVALAKEAA